MEGTAGRFCIWTREDAVRDAWMPSVSLLFQPCPWLRFSAFQSGFEMKMNRFISRFRVDFRLSPYYNKVDNKIVAIPTSSQFRWTLVCTIICFFVTLKVNTQQLITFGILFGTFIGSLGTIVVTNAPTGDLLKQYYLFGIGLTAASLISAA